MFFNKKLKIRQMKNSERRMKPMVISDQQTYDEIIESMLNNQRKQEFSINIIEDPHHRKRVMTQHQVNESKKFFQRLLYYKKTGEEAIFDGIVDDVLGIVGGEIATNGFVSGPWIISKNLNINLPEELKELIGKRIALRLIKLINLYQKYGFDLKFLGGKLENMSIIESGVFSLTINSWIDKRGLITQGAKPGDLIYGFASNGKASWEEEESSGIMIDNTNIIEQCLGPDKLTLPSNRQFAIIIKEIVSILKAKKAFFMLHGIVINHKNGCTEIKNISRKNDIMYVKDMPLPPSIFNLIQKESQLEWREMYRNFNCGVGLEIVGENNPVFIDTLKEVSSKYKIALYRLGHCLPAKSPTNSNRLIINSHFGTWEM